MSEINEFLTTTCLGCVTVGILVATVWSLFFLVKGTYRHLTKTRTEQLTDALELNADLGGKLYTVASWAYQRGWSEERFRKQVQDLLKNYK